MVDVEMSDGDGDFWCEINRLLSVMPASRCDKAPCCAHFLTLLLLRFISIWPRWLLGTQLVSGPLRHRTMELCRCCVAALLADADADCGVSWCGIGPTGNNCTVVRGGGRRCLRGRRWDG